MASVVCTAHTPSSVILQIVPSGDMDFIVCTDEETEEYGSKLHACGLSGRTGLPRGREGGSMRPQLTVTRRNFVLSLQGLRTSSRTLYPWSPSLSPQIFLSWFLFCFCFAFPLWTCLSLRALLEITDAVKISHLWLEDIVASHINFWRDDTTSNHVVFDIDMTLQINSSVCESS